MAGKKIRNLSYKKVDEHKSGVLFFILSLRFLGKKKRGGGGECIITVIIDNIVIVFRP